MPRNIDENNPIPRYVQSDLGIQRDGTAYHSAAYTDGQHVRFFHDWAEKMGGYIMINRGNGESVNQMIGVSKSVSTDVYLGRGSSLQYFNILNNGTVGPIVDRTPTGLVPDPNNSWSFTLYSNFDPNINEQITYIVAQVNVGWNDVASQQIGPVYIGNINDTAPLIPVTNGQSTPYVVEVSGGVIAFNDILVAYGNNGAITWTVPGQPFNWVDMQDTVNIQFIAHTKIVTAIEYFGTVLFWSLNSILQGTYTPPVYNSEGTQIVTASYWTIRVISNNTSILSASCAVQYNQLVFWVGERLFYVFNGAVGRLQNYMLPSWFFDNINPDNKSKTYAWVNEQFDEVWFGFPFGEDQITCNQNAIYNVGRQRWYSTQLDRSAAILLNTYKYPILSSSVPESIVTTSGTIISTYPIWSHENGVNKVLGDQIYPIQSYFEHSIFDLYTNNPSFATNLLVQTMRIEPDFVMEGEMTVTIKNRMFAQSDAQITGPITFDGNTEFIDSVVSQGRQVSLLFESNVVDGYYQAGKILHDFIPGDVNA